MGSPLRCPRDREDGLVYVATGFVAVPVSMNSPLVSVVIPAFNAALHVRDAVLSVLQQTSSDLECIVIDDGSSDGTWEVVGAIPDARVRCIRQRNGGVSRARNAGAALAAGKYLAFLDADDVWLLDKLAQQLAVFAARPSTGAVLTWYVVVDDRLKLRWAIRPGNARSAIERWLLLEGEGPAFSSTILLTREAFDAIGGFRVDVPPSEDLHFGARLIRQADVEMVKSPLVLYRTHSTQQHRDRSQFESNMLAIYDELLQGPETSAIKRRATANLYTRLLFHHVRQRDLAASWRALRHACSADPARILLLPARVGGRRIRQRLLGRALGPRMLREGPPSGPKKE